MMYLWWDSSLGACCVLTECVADLEPVFRGPIVVDFGVVGGRNNPVFVSTDLELEGGDEMTIAEEKHHQRKQKDHVAVEVIHLGNAFTESTFAIREMNCL